MVILKIPYLQNQKAPVKSHKRLCLPVMIERNELPCFWSDSLLRYLHYTAGCPATETANLLKSHNRFPCSVSRVHEIISN